MQFEALLNYQDDARSNKHKIPLVVCHHFWEASVKAYFCEVYFKKQWSKYAFMKTVKET